MNMKKTLSLIAMLMLAVCAMAQDRANVRLIFTCRTAANVWVIPDSITVENLTRGWKETLFYPDTSLLLKVSTGIENVETCHGASLQTTPNPFNGTTTVNLQMPETGDVQVEIADMQGRIVETCHGASLQPGTHNLRVSLRTPGIYMLTARVNGRTLSAKLVNTGNGGKDAVEFNGIVEAPYYDASTMPKSAKGTSTHPFRKGDQMRYVAYIAGVASADVTQPQSQNETITLVFDYQPCRGSATVTDHDGNVYNTVWLGSQCWMKENLRTKHYANGADIPAGTGGSSSSTSPYYYDYATSMPLSKRGYLYNWPAVMHGGSSSNSVPSGVQGICPNGWHVPSDAEWTELENYLAIQYQYGCGGDSSKTAKALASKEFWSNSTDNCAVGNDLSANNATGFTAYPAGYHQGYSGQLAGETAEFWTCTVSSDPDRLKKRVLRSYYVDMANSQDYGDIGFSVRCVRDQSCPGMPTVIDYDNNVYNTVQIGSQCWMKENLRTTHYSNGTHIELGNSSNGSYSEEIPYRYSLDASLHGSNGSIYGYLYNWAAVMNDAVSSSANPSGVQGICPVGWHVPSAAEWAQLVQFVKSQSPYVCANNSYNSNSYIAKALAATSGWENSTDPCDVGYDQSSNNATGFSAVPAGRYCGVTCYGYYQNFGSSAYFWSSTYDNDTQYYGHICTLFLSSDGYYAHESNEAKLDGVSVRCLRD